MAKTITDKWPIRYMRLDDEVYEAVMVLKEKYGSPNKGLRAVLIGNVLAHTETKLDFHAEQIDKEHKALVGGRPMRPKGDKTR